MNQDCARISIDELVDGLSKPVEYEVAATETNTSSVNARTVPVCESAARATDTQDEKKRGRKRTEVDPHKINQRETYYQNRKRREEDIKRQRREDELKSQLYKETLGDMVHINHTDNVFMNESMDGARGQFLDFMKTCQEHTDRQRLRIDKLLDEYYKLQQTHDAYKKEQEIKLSELQAQYTEATTTHDATNNSLKEELRIATEERDSLNTQYELANSQRDTFERGFDKVERELKILQCDETTFKTMDLKSLNRLQFKWNEKLMAINTAIANQNKDRTTCPVCMDNLINGPEQFSLCAIAQCGHKICRECYQSLHQKKCPTCCKAIDESELAPVRE